MACEGNYWLSPPRKYFRNSGFLKILYGYSALFLYTIFICIFVVVARIFVFVAWGYATCASCCMCCMRMDYTRVAYATCATCCMQHICPYFPLLHTRATSTIHIASERKSGRICEYGIDSKVIQEPIYGKCISSNYNLFWMEIASTINIYTSLAK